MIKIYNTVTGQTEYINHRLSTFLRIEVAVDASSGTNAIRIYLTDNTTTSVEYDIGVAQELIDYDASIINIEAATL